MVILEQHCGTAKVVISYQLGGTYDGAAMDENEYEPSATTLLRPTLRSVAPQPPLLLMCHAHDGGIIGNQEVRWTQVKWTHIKQIRGPWVTAWPIR